MQSTVLRVGWWVDCCYWGRGGGRTMLVRREGWEVDALVTAADLWSVY